MELLDGNEDLWANIHKMNISNELLEHSKRTHGKCHLLFLLLERDQDNTSEIIRSMSPLILIIFPHPFRFEIRT